ncbi:hypothetical protein EP7_000071 [Isosphaeraceae bacterium EP7]
MKRLLFLGWIAFLPAFAAAQAPTSKPPTVEEAAKVIDLSAFPRLPLSEGPGSRQVARLFYAARATVPEAFAFQKATLTKLGWAELPGGYAAGPSASGTFEKQGYRISVAVSTGSAPGTVSVSLINHGNLDLKALPVPAGTKVLFAGPVSVLFLSEQGVEAVADDCRKRLLALGWQPYGEAGDQRFFKQNAVQLSLRVSSAPAQGNKTMIAYAGELLSVDLPAPADGIGTHYADTVKQVTFDTKENAQGIAAYYQKALAGAGWKSTTDAPVEIERYETMFFRNAAKDILTLKMRNVDPILRVSLAHQTGAEFDEEIRLAEAREKALKSKSMTKPARPVVSVSLPTAATEIEATATEITFQLASGKARDAVRAMLGELVKAGWTQEVAALEDAGGAVSLKKAPGDLTIHYVDPGFIPAEVTISAIGVTLAKPKAR